LGVVARGGGGGGRTAEDAEIAEKRKKEDSGVDEWTASQPPAELPLTLPFFPSAISAFSAVLSLFLCRSSRIMRTIGPAASARNGSGGRTAMSMSLNELTGAIIGAAMKVHRTLGPGLLESAYRACLAYELEKMGLRVEREKPVPVVYDDVHLECGFRADMVVEGRVVVEAKAKQKLHPADHAQIISHLRLLGLPVGLLINFHEVVLKDGIKRVVNDYREEG
jgi:GxxExxY protein